MQRHATRPLSAPDRSQNLERKTKRAKKVAKVVRERKSRRSSSERVSNVLSLAAEIKSTEERLEMLLGQLEEMFA